MHISFVVSSVFHASFPIDRVVTLRSSAFFQQPVSLRVGLLMPATCRPKVGQLDLQAMDDTADGLEHESEDETERAQHDEDLDKLPPILRPHFGFDVALDPGTVGGEAACRDVLFHQLVLLVPAILHPLAKLLLVVQRHVLQGEAAPVEIH